MESIAKVSLGLMRESLKNPFGFKGASATELWQVSVGITLDNGAFGLGLGVQSVLWSAPEVFAKHGEAQGNAMMLAVTRQALKLLQGMHWTTPPMMLRAIFPQLMRDARARTGHERLPQTFVLNALVAVDFALWQLWMAEHGGGFDPICDAYAPAIRGREPRLGSIPLIGYHTSLGEVNSLLEDGAFLLKIKIGADPAHDNDPNKMLEWDRARVRQIHSMASQFETPHTQSGRPAYYLDANGRYPSMKLLTALLEDLEDAGILPHTLLLEEPFAEDALQSVKSLPICVAGDESAHSVEDAQRLIDTYGFRAIACKPIAKTLSCTLDIANAALERGAACFCADLTVPPALLDWNMAFAARLPLLSGLKAGIVESNGAQNYQNWGALLEMCHPQPADWRVPKQGMYHLDSAFYADTGIMARHPAYRARLRPLKGEDA